MEASKIIPAMVNGILVGFTIGAGFMLAKKLFTKTEVKTVVIEKPEPEQRAFAGEQYSREFANFSSGRPMQNHPINNYFPTAPRSKPQVFDFTTGQLM